MNKLPVVEYDYIITADGDTYNLSTALKLVAMDIGGQGMPEINYLTERGPYQDGETVLDYFLQPRVIQVMFRGNGCSRSEYWTLRNKLLNMLRPNRHSSTTLQSAVLRKVLPDGSKRDIKVFAENGPSFQMRTRDAWDEFGYSEVVRLIAHNPVFYDPDQDELTFVLPSVTELEFPIVFPIEFGTSLLNDTQIVTYEGTWAEFPTIIITGPLNNLVIENETTGEIIELDYNIAANEVVTIDLAYGEKSVVNDDGDNLIGVVTDNSDLATWHLAPDPEAPDGENSIHVTGTGANSTTSVTLRYCNRYIGI